MNIWIVTMNIYLKTMNIWIKNINIWIKKNCNECPTIVKFLKTIPNLKLATLSKMDPYVSLTPHKGWAEHSNNVIRCHFGLIVPKKKCYISVTDEHSNEEIQYLENNKWTLFDDSKTHYSNNTSNENRIVLIIDIYQRQYLKLLRIKISGLRRP